MGQSVENRLRDRSYNFSSNGNTVFQISLAEPVLSCSLQLALASLACAHALIYLTGALSPLEDHRIRSLIFFRIYYPTPHRKRAWRAEEKGRGLTSLFFSKNLNLDAICCNQLSSNKIFSR